MDAGLFAARLVLGSLMAAHGAQKLFGWFGGYGVAGTGAFFERLGFHPGRFFAATAALAEVAGGLLLVFGVFSPIGSALVLSVMIVAAVSVHWEHGLFAASNGIEVPLLYATGATTLALTGPGRFSLDAALGLSSIWTPERALMVLGIGVVGGVLNLAMRRIPAKIASGSQVSA